MARAPHPWRSPTPLISLIGTANEAAMSGDAVTVLRLGSELLAGVAGDDSVQLDQMVATLAANDDQGSTALLVALQNLTDDDLRRARLRRLVAQRSIPAALAGLEASAPGTAAEFIDVLADTSALVVGIVLPNQQPLVALAYLDHHHSGVVKDAFVVSADQAHITEVVRQQRPTPLHRLQYLHPADARARLESAMSRAHRLVARHPTESWPASRPLLGWMCRQLPPGGRDRPRPAWTRESRDDLATMVVRSTPTPMSAEARDTLDALIEVSCTLGSRDPLRWSPVAVELLFTERLAHAATIAGFHPDRLVEALTALVRFAHLERGVLAAHTAATVDAIERCRHQLADLARISPPPAARPLLDTLSQLDDQGIDITAGHQDRANNLELPTIDRVDYDEVLRASLYRAVGDMEALRTLHTDPLPDEDFDWTDIPTEAAPVVAAVIELVDEATMASFGAEVGVEARTAARRLVKRLVAAYPVEFVAGADAEPVQVALAASWIVGQANALLDEPEQRAALAARFNATLPPRLVTPMLRGLGVDPHQHGGLDLGMADLLVSSRRQSLVRQRDEGLPDL